MIKAARSISWIKATLKDFEDFPVAVQTETLRVLTVAAEELIAHEIDLVHERIKRLKEIL
jgi:hypothetical protein